MFIILLLFDLVIITLCYFAVYHVIDNIITTKTEIFKLLFNVDIRLNYYKREQSQYDKNDTLNFISSVIVVCLLSIKPIINCIVYALFFNFVDVIQINYIFLLISWCMFLRYAKDKRNIDWYLLGQIFYTIINYENIESLFPTCFQLVDDCFNAEVLVEKTLNVIVGITNIPPPKQLLRAIKFLKSNQDTIRITHFTILTLLFVYSLLYTDLYMSSECLFYIYVPFRLEQLYSAIN